ncbi:cullin-4A [Platysternon megacephalum]|uniref:Cullin-4A n=1 Tax=Platysternon megacephalum TaxID=55544 RepID=A0A4D9ERD1_9SAUR|nr:cullin-4A [Platysternon megacephalum]
MTFVWKPCAVFVACQQVGNTFGPQPALPDEPQVQACQSEEKSALDYFRLEVRRKKQQQKNVIGCPIFICCSRALLPDELKSRPHLSISVQTLVITQATASQGGGLPLAA